MKKVNKIKKEVVVMPKELKESKKFKEPRKEVKEFKNKVLMPIKPKYANQILDGTKKFEYRKSKIRKETVRSVIIYATVPVKKVIGEAEIVDIIEDTPENIQNQTLEHSGISKEDYDKYFKGKDTAVAYVLGNTKKYNKEKSLAKFDICYYPQSYVYVSSPDNSSE